MMTEGTEPNSHVGADIPDTEVRDWRPMRGVEPDVHTGRARKWQYNIRQIVTVEPLIFLFMCATGIHNPAIQALTYHKVCMDKFGSQEICDNLKNGSFNAEEDLVQTGASHWFLYQTLGFEIPSIILSFFYGAVSDHFSRRLAIVLPLIGQVITVGNYIFCAVYLESHIFYIVIGHTISGLFGGWITFLLAVFSYLAEVTSEEARTSRISVAEAMISLSIALSYFISGIILDHTSYTFVFALSMALYLAGAFYTYLWIKEPQKSYKDNSRLVSSFIQVFQPRRIKDSFMCMFRKRADNMKKRLLMLLLGVLTTMLSYNALYTLGYLYLKRRPLSWSQSTFGMYVGYYKGLGGLGLAIIVPTLKKKFHMSDTMIILLSLVSASVSELFFGLSVKTWMVFLAPVIGILSDAKMTCMRALLSTFVEKHELGQLFAAVGSIQSLSGMIGSVFFNTIYPHTLSFWPGFCFSLGVVISIIPLSIIIWLHKNLKMFPKYKMFDGAVVESTEVLLIDPSQALDDSFDNSFD